MWIGLKSLDVRVWNKGFIQIVSRPPETFAIAIIITIIIIIIIKVIITGTAVIVISHSLVRGNDHQTKPTCSASAFVTAHSSTAQTSPRQSHHNQPGPVQGLAHCCAISASGEPATARATVGAIAQFQCGVSDTAILLRWLRCQPSVMADVAGALGLVAAAWLLAAWKAALL